MELFAWGNFNQIIHLWTLLIVFLLFYLAKKKRKKTLNMLIEHRLIKDLDLIQGQSMRKTKSVLILLCLFFIVLALMNPQFDYTYEKIRKKGIDIVIALDTSKSMLAQDIKPNRFQRSQLEIKNLINSLDGDRLGLVLFTQKAIVQCPLTVDYSSFNLFIDEAEVGTLPSGGTSLASAINKSIECFDPQYKKHRILIVITDGETHDQKLDDAIEKALNMGIKIFTVGMGSKEGTPILISNENGQSEYVKDSQGNIVLSKLNETSLKKMALKTGGAYINGSGGAFNLEKIYLEKIAPIEGREIESERKKRYENRFYIPLAIALVFLLIETFLSEKS